MSEVYWWAGHNTISLYHIAIAILTIVDAIGIISLSSFWVKLWEVSGDKGVP